MKPNSDRIRYTNQSLSPNGFSSMTYKKFTAMIHNICKVNKPAEFLDSINTFQKIFINTDTGEWSILPEDDFQFKSSNYTTTELINFNKKTKDEREFKNLSRIEKLQKQQETLFKNKLI
jgi:hypothetical protein